MTKYSSKGQVKRQKNTNFKIVQDKYTTILASFQFNPKTLREPYKKDMGCSFQNKFYYEQSIVKPKIKKKNTLQMILMLAADNILMDKLGKSFSMRWVFEKP